MSCKQSVSGEKLTKGTAGQSMFLNNIQLTAVKARHIMANVLAIKDYLYKQFNSPEAKNEKNKRHFGAVNNKLSQ